MSAKIESGTDNDLYAAPSNAQNVDNAPAADGHVPPGPSTNTVPVAPPLVLPTAKDRYNEKRRNMAKKKAEDLARAKLGGAQPGGALDTKE